MVRNSIRLSSVLSDIFGKSGLLIINGLIEGTPFEQILETFHNPRILKKKDEIERAICGELGETDLYVIRQSLESIRHHDAQIVQYEERILKTLSCAQETLKILMSVLGIGFTMGSAILAEIGDISQFWQSEAVGQLGRPRSGSLRSCRENCTRAYHQTRIKIPPNDAYRNCSNNCLGQTEPTETVLSPDPGMKRV